MNMISELENQNSYVSKISFKTTVRTGITESVDSMSEEEKLETFKKELWREIDSWPRDSRVSESIQITDAAFERMMTDEDFKNRMMSKMHEDAVVCRPPIVWVSTCIDENGYRGISYNDYSMGNAAFGEHSKHKDSFYVKTAKNQKTDDAWMRLKQSMEKHREMVEEEYLKKYYNNKTFLHREQIADLYYNNVLEADSIE